MVIGKGYERYLSQTILMNLFRGISHMRRNSVIIFIVAILFPIPDPSPENGNNFRPEYSMAIQGH
jgi:hypothetical protein